MDLEADHDLPFARGALDAVAAHHHHFSGLARKLRAALDREAGVEHALFVERAADDLQAERQAVAS